MHERRAPGYLDFGKFNFFWEDPYFTPQTCDRGDMAAFLGVSTQTIDNWIRLGAPVLKLGGFGAPHIIPIQPFLTWAMAYRSNVTVEEFKDYVTRIAADAEYRRNHPKHALLGQDPNIVPGDEPAARE